MRVFIIFIFICLPLSVNITFYFTQSQKSYFKGPCCCILSVSSHSSTGSLCQGWAFTVSVSSSYTFTLWPDHGAISLHIRPEEKSLLVHTCHKDICCFQQSSSGHSCYCLLNVTLREPDMQICLSIWLLKNADRWRDGLPSVTSSCPPPPPPPPQPSCVSHSYPLDDGLLGEDGV